MITNIIIIILNITSVILLALALKKVKSSEKFTNNYDENCVTTCKSQSANADDQCLNDCQIPCKDNTCWRSCYLKSKTFDEYLRCGQKCKTPYI